jgi:polysaccharide biosynthesis/export protein
MRSVSHRKTTTSSAPEDVLAINVWKEPEISRNVPVRPDGKISLPLVGDLQASGQTTLKLRDTIADKLKDYISNPEVIVIVQEFKSQSFNIIGKVGKPGSYELAKPMTVLDAIAAAGGFQDFAKVTSNRTARQPLPREDQRCLGAEPSLSSATRERPRPPA